MSKRHRLVDPRGHLRVPAERMKWWREPGGCRSMAGSQDEELVEVLLQGKAPWGFTLRGGAEHREPLIITKVEEGSAAATVCLRAGDEMVSVNAVPLSGSRQEAISLVKSSHKTLTLVVRRAKMVDVVSTRAMPSESEVRVARSFLTKILRSSMRKHRFRQGKNDPGSRPHSWYSSKLTGEELESAKREATAATVWQPKNEPKPKDPSEHGEQDSQQQLGSLKTMERLEQPALLYPAGHVSPTTYISSEPFCGLGGKKDGLSCFSTGSSPPGLDSSSIGWKGTSTENMFFKGLQSECSQAAEHPRFLQPAMGNGGWDGELAATRLAVKANAGPVWQLPEKKKEQSPPPPPPPPLRSDSFAVTKVFPYPEGPVGPTKNKGRSTEKLSETSDLNGFRSYQKNPLKSRNSLTPLSAKDFLHPGFAANQNQNQLQNNRLFSLSSTDVRQSHHSTLPAHQRQYSDESPRYLHSRMAAPGKVQSVGSYYRSLQDLPNNALGHQQGRHSTASVANFPANPSVEKEGLRRYYGLTSSAELQARPAKAEGRKPDKPHWLIGSEPGYYGSFKTNMKAKYCLPQFQMPYSGNKEHNNHSHLGLQYEHKGAELSAQSPEDSSKKCEGRSSEVKKLLPACQSSTPKVILPRQEAWFPQEDQRISPLKTPLLHSLAQESLVLSERHPAAAGGKCALDSSDVTIASGGKSNRRSDRYATTLRNEIQQKRAQLQKSRSAATLTCEAEDEEAKKLRASKVSPASAVSFSNTYKDHLKEAQAKVLQATSFQRRDLEPLVVKTSNGRVRGRRRCPLAKKTHSFSEPDKIDQVGVETEAQTGSFRERRRFFESKPAFSRPVLKSSHSAGLNADSGETSKDKTPTGEGPPAADTSETSTEHEQASQEQQRLGTFAEYQATWSKYKKCSDVKSQGRYHSTDNILDADAEETSACVHERSRSSPSADFHTQSVSSSWEDPPNQQISGSSRLPFQRDSSPEAASAPRNEDVAPNHADHRTRAEEDSPAHPTHPSGPRSLSPGPGSQDAVPTPRSHLAPETTASSLSSSCQSVPSGVQADPASFQSQSSTNSHQHTTSSSPVGPAPAGLPSQRGAAQDGEDEEDRKTSGPCPLPSVFADRARTPSPQFGPQRLTDRPPVVLVQDDSLLRSENDVKLPAGMDVLSPGRKVSVRIVHTDNSCGHEASHLPQGSQSCCSPQLSPCVPSGGTTEPPAPESSSAGPLLLEEDAKREELARDIMGKDRTLVDILDQSGRMTTMDLMEGIFPTEEQLFEGVFQRRRTSVGSRMPLSSPRSTYRREEDSMSASAAVVSLVPSSSYYNTSAPKAELLIKMKDMQEQLEEQESEDELDIDLASKKQELIFSLAGKLEVLREARHSLQEDVEENEALGREVEATVQRLCQPNQLDKFRMFVGDLDKVVSLLLSLSGRLARVENALYSLEEEAPPEERRTLTEKRKLLMRQHEDAKELKENLDRRERLVAGIMESHLDAESLDDYRYFVKMKSALIIEQRKLEDKIKLGEEQLKCLLDSLPLEQRPLL